MKNLFARLAAATGIVALIGTSAFAAPATMAKHTMAKHTMAKHTMAKHTMAKHTMTKPGMTAVKSHVRHLKSGKVVMVHSYNRPKPGMKMTHVKGYTTKTGKVVKGYTRKPSMKKTMPKMKH